MLMSVIVLMSIVGMRMGVVVMIMVMMVMSVIVMMQVIMSDRELPFLTDQGDGNGLRRLIASTGTTHGRWIFVRLSKSSF